ncbi:MAG: sulfatase-like hydrolase/transferase, partial [Elusimicrobia bacterium]|nr:sulfatase-like hydrolase/transferase [Elusimicrobiota bacterium]
GTRTLASVLREYGYRTVWAGTTDAYNGYPALRGGFDEAVAPRVWKHDWSGAFSWLEKNHDAPFFMFLHTWSAQSPYTPADAAARRFLPAFDPAKSISYEGLEREAAARVLRSPQRVFAPAVVSAHPNIFADPARPPEWSALAELMDARGSGGGKHPSSWKVLDKVYWDRFDLRQARDRAYVRALYDASVYQADESIGELLRRLESLGLSKRTLIVVIADHGEAFGEHGTWRHGHGGNVHVEALRVPLIFAFPDARFRLRSDAVAQSIDVMPTVLQAVGAEPPASMQGVSLMPIITGGRADSSGTAFASWRGHYAVRDARYACLLRDACAASGAVPEKRCLSLSLYDRRADPGETRDVRLRFPAAAEKCEDLLLRRLAE